MLIISFRPLLFSYIVIPKIRRRATTKVMCVPLKQADSVESPALMQNTLNTDKKLGSTDITLHINTRGMECLRLINRERRVEKVDRRHVNPTADMTGKIHWHNHFIL